MKSLPRLPSLLFYLNTAIWITLALFTVLRAPQSVSSGSWQL